MGALHVSPFVRSRDENSPRFGGDLGLSILPGSFALGIFDYGLPLGHYLLMSALMTVPLRRIGGNVAATQNQIPAVQSPFDALDVAGESKQHLSDSRRGALRARWTVDAHGIFLSERSSAGASGAGGNETGWRVKVMESLADRAAPAVVQERLVRFLYTDGHL